MLVRGGRTQDELGVATGNELDRFPAGFEDRDLALLNDLRRGDLALAGGDPQHAMALRRLVFPSFAHPKFYGQVVDRRGGRNGADGAGVASKQDAGRPGDGNIASALIEARRRTELEIWRQGDPQLEAAGTARPAATATDSSRDRICEATEPSGGV